MPLPTLDLSKTVMNEQALMSILGCNRKHIHRFVLKEGLPAVRLQVGLYAFLTADVLAWLESRKMPRFRPTASDVSQGVSG